MSGTSRVVALVTRRLPTATALVIAVLAAGCGGAAASKPLPLTHVVDIALPGRATRFDYADVDQTRDLLVVAHLGDDQVVAVDLATRRIAWTASNLASVHGIRIDPKLGRVFATATATNEVAALDETTGREIARASTGEFPDGVAVDNAINRILVSNKDGGTVSVFQEDPLAPLGDVRVGGDVGNVQIDTANGRALVADGSDNHLVTVDITRQTILATDKLEHCRGAHGVAVDATTRRAYVACEDNATVIVEDVDQRREIARLSVGDTPDVLAIDDQTHRLYIAAESGTVTAVSLDATPTVIGRAHVADRAHTVAVDPGLRLVAFALPDVNGRPVLRLDFPT